MSRQQIQQIQNSVDEITASRPKLEKAIKKYGYYITIAVYLSEAYEKYRDWHTAKVHLQNIFIYKDLPPLIQNVFDRLEMAGHLIENVGPMAFNIVCEKVNPLFTAALYLSLEKQNNRSLQISLNHLMQFEAIRAEA